MQYHGSDTYSIRKKQDLCSTILKLHMRQVVHGKHSSIVKGNRAPFANNILLHRWIESFDEPGGKGAFEMHFIFFGTHFEFHTQISHALAYGVRISSKDSVITAGLLHMSQNNASVTLNMVTSRGHNIIWRAPCKPAPNDYFVAIFQVAQKFGMSTFFVLKKCPCVFFPQARKQGFKHILESSPPLPFSHPPPPQSPSK